MALSAAAAVTRVRMSSGQESVGSWIEMESLSFPQPGEILCDIALEQMMVDG
jgi:hypothetical protein